MLKALAWAMVLYEYGGRTLNLNISEAVVNAAHGDPRLTFAQYLRERIKRELTKSLKPLGVACPDFFFAVESTELGKTHLHGAILSRHETTFDGVIREALFHAMSGKKVMRTGTEVHLDELVTPAKWVNYCAKWWRGSAFDPEGRVFAATSGLRSVARDWYVEARRDEGPLTGHDRVDDGLLPA